MVLDQAIESTKSSQLAFCKFITGNETGATGSHQYGFYIPKSAYFLLFSTPGEKGSNKDRFVTIRWQKDFETNSRFIYYGTGTRNEYRITQFGRGFPFLQDEYLGDLFVLTKVSEEFYEAFVLTSEDDIEDYLSCFGMTVADTNRIIDQTTEIEEVPTYEALFARYVAGLTVDFPISEEVSRASREILQQIEGRALTVNPDRLLIGWLDVEYRLFKAIENDRYSARIATRFSTVEELVECANSLLNRRKSRAGKSLEHHLTEMFRMNELPFTSQSFTEGRKKPDFLFPSGDAYHDLAYEMERLIFLGAKTTCKDRWRQILNEADRIPTKHLFTLQPSISEHQLKEMYQNQVVLVVPETNLKSFPKAYQEKILTLRNFLDLVRRTCVCAKA